ncbi:MAG: hypothetical protein ABIH83_02875 [Candidatus Micrarchaeota archaeon]
MRVICALFAILFLFSGFLFSLPIGINSTSISAGTPVTLGDQTAGTVSAWGGNITRVNLTINSSTLHWQGFYGTISGTLTLAGGNSTLRLWNASNITGQIYVSRDSNVNFTGINATSANLSQVDSAFSFLGGASDSAPNTGTDSANSAFSIGQYRVYANTYPKILTRNSTGSSVWEQVVLRHSTDGDSEDFVFVGLVNSSGVAYNGDSAHFQLIVPEDAAGDASATTYYFYGELQ